jgi:hypothetical protein
VVPLAPVAGLRRRGGWSPRPLRRWAPRRLRWLGELPVWELLRRAEVRSLVGGRGGLSLLEGRYPRYTLLLPPPQRWQLKRLQRLLAPGHLSYLPIPNRYQYVVTGASLQRLLDSFEGFPTPPRWERRLGGVIEALASPIYRPLPPTVVEEPEVVEAPPRPLHPHPPREGAWEVSGLVFGPDPRWSLELQLQWLAGLVDGDGTLSARRDGSTLLSIAGHRSEVEVLEGVRRLLGHGRVTLRGPGGANYALAHGPRLRWLLEYLGPFLRHPIKRRQLREVCHRLNRSVPVPVGLAANRGWVAGVIQSDGSIVLGVMQREDGCRYPITTITFTNTEAVLVKAVASFFPGRGHIQHASRQRETWLPLMV